MSENAAQEVGKKEELYAEKPAEEQPATENAEATNQNQKGDGPAAAEANGQKTEEQPAADKPADKSLPIPTEPFVDPIPVTKITSRVIKTAAPDWADKAFLIPHEFLRSDMTRIARLLQHFNPEKYAWKARVLRDWFTMWTHQVHAHHDNEELIFFPHYKALGVNFPERQASDHKVLLSNMDEIGALINECCDKPSAEKSAEFCQKWMSFREHMEEHLAEEESFWPDALREHGTEQYKLCMAKLMKVVQADRSYAGGVELAAIIQTVGAQTMGNTTEGWGDAETRAEFEALPWPLRRCCFLGPKFMRQFEWERQKLHTLTQDVENQPQVPFPRSRGACGGGWSGACAVL